MRKRSYAVLWLAGHLFCAEAQDRAVSGDTLRYIREEVPRTEIRYGQSGEREREMRYMEADTIGDRILPAEERMEKMEVIRSVFRRDWFIFASTGVHTFQGDYSYVADFTGTLSPDITAGVGYWFTPYVGMSVRFTRSESRGYSGYVTGYYGFGYGEVMLDKELTPYRKMKTGWWNTALSLQLNMTRLVSGYEGYRSRRNRNQFILNVGGGCLHHLGYDQPLGTGYEWSGHAELQYSLFFGRRRRLSLDVRGHWLFCHTNFDYESRRKDRRMDRMDSNIGLQAGFTLYLGRVGKKEKERILPPPSEGGYDYRIK